MQSNEPRSGPTVSSHRRHETIRGIQAALSDTEELLDPQVIAARARAADAGTRRKAGSGARNDDDVAAARNAYRSAVPGGAAMRSRDGQRLPTRREPSRPAGKRGFLAEFVRRHGWRAYAIPVLVVITVVAVAGMDSGVRKAVIDRVVPQADPAPSQAAPNQQLKVDEVPGGPVAELVASYELPSGQRYTEKGNGHFTVLPGTTAVAGSGRVWKYTVDVEGGISKDDQADFAKVVTSTLSDRRSWIASGKVGMQRVDGSTSADFHVSLVSSLTVRALCGYTIKVETSCYDSAHQRVVVNTSRWVRGDLAYVGDLDAYRVYMVNHEVGHAIGHNHSHVCLAGGFAPVMMQQTLGLKSETGTICQANPWPYPPGAGGAPGAEAPDTEANSPIQRPQS